MMQNSTTNYEWVKLDPDNWSEAKFTIKSINYYVQFWAFPNEVTGHECVKMSFCIKQRDTDQPIQFSLTHTKNEIKVFSYVIQIAKDFMYKYNKPLLYQATDTHRLSLYFRFAYRNASSFTVIQNQQEHCYDIIIHELKKDITTT